ncbi:hypothetical protein J6590_019992 [Homalodisca vitripennis]|nr:hypothetical protein J6590_019992 [Homalodisca vitripennis]
MILRNTVGRTGSLPPGIIVTRTGAQGSSLQPQRKYVLTLTKKRKRANRLGDRSIKKGVGMGKTGDTQGHTLLKIFRKIEQPGANLQYAPDAGLTMKGSMESSGNI